MPVGTDSWNVMRRMRAGGGPFVGPQQRVLAGGNGPTPTPNPFMQALEWVQKQINSGVGFVAGSQRGPTPTGNPFELGGALPPPGSRGMGYDQIMGTAEAALKGLTPTATPTPGSAQSGAANAWLMAERRRQMGGASPLGGSRQPQPRGEPGQVHRVPRRNAGY